MTTPIDRTAAHHSGAAMRQPSPAIGVPWLAQEELARRLIRAMVPCRDPLSRPNLVATYLYLRYVRRHQEVVGGLYLDHRRWLADQEIFRGGLCKVVAQQALLLRPALETGARQLLAFHIRPQRGSQPDAADLAFTLRLREAGELVRIRLVDLWILGSPTEAQSVLGNCAPHR